MEQIIGSHQFSLRTVAGRRRWSSSTWSVICSGERPARRGSDPGGAAAADGAVSQQYFTVGAGQRQEVHRRRPINPATNRLAGLAYRYSGCPPAARGRRSSPRCGRPSTSPRLIVGHIDGAGFQLLMEGHNLSRTSLRRRASRLQSGSSIRTAADYAQSPGPSPPAGAGRRELRRFAVEQRLQLQHLRHFSTRGCQLLFSSLRTFMPKVICRAPTDAETGHSSGRSSRSSIARRGGGDVLIMQPDLAFATGSSPASRRSRVLFPQPDGPPAPRIRLRGYPATGR